MPCVTQSLSKTTFRLQNIDDLFWKRFETNRRFKTMLSKWWFERRVRVFLCCVFASLLCYLRKRSCDTKQNATNDKHDLHGPHQQNYHSAFAFLKFCFCWEAICVVHTTQMQTRAAMSFWKRMCWNALKHRLRGPHHTNDDSTSRAAKLFSTCTCWSIVCLAHTTQMATYVVWPFFFWWSICVARTTQMHICMCRSYALKSDLCGPHHTDENLGAHSKKLQNASSSSFAWPTPSKLQF